MIALGSDHAGYELKNSIKKYLYNKNIEYKDFGTFDQTSTDYPTYALKVAKAVASGICNAGILCCGTGIGVSIAANKIKGIRAAVCWNELSAKMCRQHNDANIITLGSRIVSEEDCFKIADIFLNTDFEGGRHKKRLDLIKEIEDENFI